MRQGGLRFFPNDASGGPLSPGCGCGIRSPTWFTRDASVSVATVIWDKYLGFTVGQTALA